MRIISDFNDYYDSAQKFGQDERVIYQRKQYEFDEVAGIPEVIAGLFEKAHEHLRRNLVKRHSWINSQLLSLNSVATAEINDIQLYSMCVFFSGVIYQGVKLTIPKTISTPEIQHYFYNFEAIIDYFKQIKVINLDKKNYRYDKLTTRQSLEVFFKLTHSNTLRSWLINHKVSNALFMHKKIQINPRLKDIEFFKVMDAWTAYQALDMWISGTLAYPQEILIEIEDRYKIPQHGFDKWSFRKKPEQLR